MKVLIAEDDQHTRRGLAEILDAEGYRTIAAKDGREAVALVEREKPDFICLDIMMPGINGYDVCREIRKKNPTVPIIFISAKSEEIDKILGLELGADDFIVKPFGVKEVVARIRAVTRRCLARPAQAVSFVMGGLTVLPDELRARRGQAVIDLSLRDIKILTLLHANAGKVVTRDAFFNECWGLDHIPNSRTLDQHIAQLRKRIELDPKTPVIIQTVHGLGYRYDK
ncbi:MAG: Alkaline phosphatase synthesis transcriptional regulatory protein PhoP [Verrucomicrobiae bacterium]|nr:Alkaline phosphatase synthesis transcriptional regulatory protein PhoP [Verrucomicrobiae bacterium]